jgi:hypothetical protein
VTQVGDTLTRIDETSDLPAKATIVATKDGLYVLQSAVSFSSPFELSANELRLIYNGDGQAVPGVVDEPAAWRDFGAQMLAKADRNAQQRFIEERESLTPEEILAAADPSDD